VILFKDLLLLQVLFVDMAFSVVVSAIIDNPGNLTAVHFNAVAGWKWIADIRAILFSLL
jgi:hypothetical protein